MGRRANGPKGISMSRRAGERAKGSAASEPAELSMPPLAGAWLAGSAVTAGARGRGGREKLEITPMDQRSLSHVSCLAMRR